MKWDLFLNHIGRGALLPSLCLSGSGEVKAIGSKINLLSTWPINVLTSSLKKGGLHIGRDGGHPSLCEGLRFLARHHIGRDGGHPSLCEGLRFLEPTSRRGGLGVNPPYVKAFRFLDPASHREDWGEPSLCEAFRFSWILFPM